MTRTTTQQRSAMLSATTSTMTDIPFPHPPPNVHHAARARSSIESTTSTSTTITHTTPPVALSKPDIEHVPVENDPRKWSPLRKNLSLFLISAAAMISGLAGSIQNPAVEEMETELPATSQQFSLSLSIFILVQGLMPLIWCAISEVKGRKLVYLISLTLFTVTSTVVATSKSIALVIVFRAIQAAGSSAVISIGAATLADIFEPAERGTKMGIYYIAPLLGPALGPILGGVLTTGLGWRAIFWFLCILSGVSAISFLFFFNDTFRKERSLIYQNALRQRLMEMKARSAKSPGPSSEEKCGVDANTSGPTTSPSATLPGSTLDLQAHAKSSMDVEKATEIPKLEIQVELSLKDVNPFKPIGTVLRRINNLAILFASGLMFALTYMTTYTSARTLSTHYHYNALKIGLVTITYGIGCVTGSLLGGFYSDMKLKKMKAANGGHSYPEMRLHSTTLGICLLPPLILAYGWVCEKHLHVAVLCVVLFFAGFFTIWTYASTLAYIVDANQGRSATAVATNSSFRGFSAFIATEIAVPLQDGIGDGWLYTIWAFGMLLTSFLIVVVSWKGEKWRKEAEEREALAESS